MLNVQGVVCSVQCLVSICSVPCVVCTVHLKCVMSIWQFVVCRWYVQCVLVSVQCAVCSVQCTMCSVQCAYTSGSHCHCHCHLADSLQTLLGLLLLALPTAKDQSKIKARATQIIRANSIVFKSGGRMDTRFCNIFLGLCKVLVVELQTAKNKYALYLIFTVFCQINMCLSYFLTFLCAIFLNCPRKTNRSKKVWLICLLSNKLETSWKRLIKSYLII